MNKEDASEPNANTLTSKTHEVDQLPPQLTRPQAGLLWIARILLVACPVYLAYHCLRIFHNADGPTALTCWPYVALLVFLSALITHFVVQHEPRIHESRKEDRSEIEALIQEALNSIQTDTDSTKGGEKAQIHQKLGNEIHRLRTDLGPAAWTEYQVLTLKQILVDVLPTSDLLARARSVLEELREYAEGPAFSYNSDLFYRWQTEIHTNMAELKEGNAEEKERAESNLRANIKSVYEHVADYKSNWSEGSTIVSSIRICGAATVIVFVLLGIIHLVYFTQGPTHEQSLQFSILHWGCLGVAGATTNVLINLRNSDEVEVANNAGKQELWRIVLGVPLGFVAGILSYSGIKGGLLASGPIVPQLGGSEASSVDSQVSSVYLSIIWAVGSGLALERVFQRVRRMVDHQGQ